MTATELAVLAAVLFVCFVFGGEALVSDTFDEMWAAQVEFMKLLQRKRGFPSFPADITSKSGQKFLKDIAHHVMDELFEASQLLKNAKSHRATLVPEVDRGAYVEELVDAQKLLLELVIASGITRDEFIEAFEKKTSVNTQRIESGY